MRSTPWPRPGHWSDRALVHDPQIATVDQKILFVVKYLYSGIIGADRGIDPTQ